VESAAMGKHIFFDLLGRHPLSIILAAKLYRNNNDMTLKDLYEKFTEEGLKRENWPSKVNTERM
jgi:hypothetical protein